MSAAGGRRRCGGSPSGWADDLERLAGSFRSSFGPRLSGSDAVLPWRGAGRSRCESGGPSSSSTPAPHSARLSDLSMGAPCSRRARSAFSESRPSCPSSCCASARGARDSRPILPATSQRLPDCSSGLPRNDEGLASFDGSLPSFDEGGSPRAACRPASASRRSTPSLGRFALSWSLPRYASRGAFRTPGRRYGLRATLCHRARPLSLRLEPPELFAAPLSPLVEPPEAFVAPPRPLLEPPPFTTRAALPACRAALRRFEASHSIPSSAPREPRAARRVSPASLPVPCASPGIRGDALATHRASRRPPGSLARRPGGSPRARSASRR
jgi:hypothetical protein